MSKFIERLKEISQNSAKSMGFRTTRTEQSRPRIQLVVNIQGNKTKPTTKQLSAADALVMPTPESDAGDIVYGVWLAHGSTRDVEQAAKARADFVILPTNSNIPSPDNKLGKILQIESSIADTLLRTANELPVDAVLLSEGKESGLALTWQRLMLIPRFSALLNKPLLVEVATDTNSNELRLIWETGASGVIVTVNDEQSDTVLQNLRKVINALPFPSRRKKDSTMALIPHVTPESEEPEEDEEDDD